MVDLSRLRQRFGHRSHQFYHLQNKPSRECHLMSVIGSSLSVVLLVMALAMKEWANANNSTCVLEFGLYRVRLQHINSTVLSGKDYAMTNYYKEDQQILISCIISVTILTILSSIIATTISLGYPREKLEFLRHFSIFNIVSLFCTALVGGLWLAVVQSLPNGLVNIKICNLHNINVHFGYCYYILLVGGICTVVAASVNFLCGRTAAYRRRQLRLRMRQQQTRSAVEPRSLSIQRDLNSHSLLLPPYRELENDLNDEDTGRESETSLTLTNSETPPVSLPPPYIT